MNQKLRDDMMMLKGRLEAIGFPLVWESITNKQAYYDLIDSINEEYESILRRIFEDYEG